MYRHDGAHVARDRLCTPVGGREDEAMATAYVRWQREELMIRHPDSMSQDTARAIVCSVARAGLLPARRRGERSRFRPFQPRRWVGRYAGAHGSCVVVLVGDVVHIGWHDA